MAKKEKKTAAEETVETVNGSACFMIPESLLRTAGSFTVWADGKPRLHFIVERTTSDGKPLTISEVDGTIYVRSPADTSATGMGSPWALEIDNAGNLLLYYPDNGTPPDLHVNNDGDLIFTIEG